MTTPAELVRDHATQLAGYRNRLEDLITEHSTPTGSVGMSPRPADAPLPGNAPAFNALMVIWEAVFRIEEFLHDEDADPWDDLTFYPRQRRGPNPGTSSFLAALDAIPKLAAGRNEDIEAWAARQLDRLCNAARIIPDIDEAQRWRALPSRACPHCGCWFLKVLVGATGQPDGRVECFGHKETGEPCRTVWQGGLIEIGAALEAA